VIEKIPKWEYQKINTKNPIGAKASVTYFDCSTVVSYKNVLVENG
jgi:hypothetical protein